MKNLSVVAISCIGGTFSLFIQWKNFLFHLFFFEQKIKKSINNKFCFCIFLFNRKTKKKFKQSKQIKKKQMKDSATVCSKFFVVDLSVETEKKDVKNICNFIINLQHL